MCGIAGFLGRCDALRDDACIASMTSTLEHRGPDDVGTWRDPEAGIAFGHRRLSILDLSASGRQPMLSPSGRFIVTYNGELYNHAELREQLEMPARQAASLAGRSDTAVLLAAIERWGVRAAVDRFVGMFAFALWDRDERALYLVRDRLGEKPLYYGRMGGVLLFGSELRALRAHPLWRGEVDREALDTLIRFGYIPAPRSIYRGVEKLLPGSILRVSEREPDGVQETYWCPKQVFEHAREHPYTGSLRDASVELDTLLRQAVRGQLSADVPVGAFLSGGLDSSAVTAVMQQEASQSARTFTIGFTDGADEAGFARAVAAHLGTEHTELYVTGDDALRLIAQLPQLYDEPFADSSLIPTYLVAQLARRDVTVALSGDGGDELFGGYRYYQQIGRAYRRWSEVPGIVRHAAAIALGVCGASPIWSTVDALRPVLPRGLTRAEVRHRIAGLARRCAAPNAVVMYQGVASRWNASGSPVTGAAGHAMRSDPGRWATLAEPERAVMHQDLISYLPDDLMVKVDRATMAVSLESRAPFLDHRVVEFSARLPLDFAIHDGRGKWLLRQVLHRYVPEELVERPKQGFGSPIGTWMRGPLREWGESLISHETVNRDGFFDPSLIRRLWAEHQAGSSYWTALLWSVLMFQSWHACWEGAA